MRGKDGGETDRQRQTNRFRQKDGQTDRHREKEKRTGAREKERNLSQQARHTDR